MLKRYTQKHKAATILGEIGFPQKKQKLREEMGSIFQVVSGKMEDENKQFFDLLSETS
jgi:hypothetical protein